MIKTIIYKDKIIYHNCYFSMLTSSNAPLSSFIIIGNELILESFTFFISLDIEESSSFLES